MSEANINHPPFSGLSTSFLQPERMVLQKIFDTKDA